jgi:SAM-dependent methyltransferase
MYGEICAQFYDMDKPYAPALALEWYGSELQRHLKGQTEPRVFEPMCGTGRFILPLLKRGFQVDGADPSEPMLKRCHDRLVKAQYEVQSPWGTSESESDQPVRVHLWQQKLQELELPEGTAPYAAAFIPAASFCLIHEPADVHAALTRLREHLQEGAPALIEFELPHPEINWPGEAVKTATQGGTQIRLVSRVTYDFATQLESYHNVYELKQSGKVVATEDETMQLRCYAPDEIRSELQKAGFRDIRIEHPDFGWVATAFA